jgi:hypothetical protein
VPNDERGHNFRNQQEELRTGDRGGTSSSDSMSARTLTVALGVVLGLLVVLVVLLVR